MKAGRLIMALPVVNNNHSLAAEVIEERPRAVRISNGTTSMWVPRSQLIRTTAHQVVIRSWFAVRSTRFLEFVRNESPEYLKWTEKDRADRSRIAEWIRESGGFQCKLDHGDR